VNSKRLQGVIQPYIEAVIPAGLITKKTKWLVNPTGKFEIGGPDGDAGITGPQDHRRHLRRRGPARRRRLLRQGPDQGGPLGRLRLPLPAKNVVAAGLAKKCTIQISYAIGVADPLSFYVDLHNTGEIDPAKLEAALPQMIGGATPRGHPRASDAEPADLCPHRRLRPLRPQAGQRRAGSRGNGPTWSES
jgi:S-adenosylmethionine synthetase